MVYKSFYLKNSSDPLYNKIICNSQLMARGPTQTSSKDIEATEFQIIQTIKIMSYKKNVPLSLQNYQMHETISEYIPILTLDTYNSVSKCLIGEDA